MDDQIKKIQEILGPDIKKHEAVIIKFGQYKNETMGNIASVDMPYINWLLDQSWTSLKVKTAAREIINKKERK